MNQTDLDTLLRKRGGLEALARELGQDETRAATFDLAANDNVSPTRTLWRRLLNSSVSPASPRD